MYTRTQLILINFLSKVIKFGFWFFWCVGLAYISSKIFGYDFERIQGLGLFMTYILAKSIFPAPTQGKPIIVPVPVQNNEDNEEEEE